MKITFNQAFAARNKLTSPQNSTEKPNLLTVKGDAALKVYWLRVDINNAFEGEFERLTDLQKELQQLNKKRQENKTGLSKKDSNRADEINKELSKIGVTENEVELTHGKINIDQIKDVCSPDDLAAIDFAINFETSKK